MLSDRALSAPVRTAGQLFAISRETAPRLVEQRLLREEGQRQLEVAAGKSDSRGKGRARRFKLGRPDFLRRRAGLGEDRRRERAPVGGRRPPSGEIGGKALERQQGPGERVEPL